MRRAEIAGKTENFALHRDRYGCDGAGEGGGMVADFEGLGAETGADAEGTGFAVYFAFASSIFDESP
jgi:hypothetical protein